jgi:Ca-activated chloride channel family protein
LKKLCTIALLLAFTGILQAQPLSKGVKQLTRIEFVFDSSQSMWSRWESSTKMDVSKNLLCNLIDSLRKIDNLELALRVYGHQKNYPPQDCDDTKLEVPFGPLNHKRIKDKVNSLSPSGTTPIALSLIACENDFPDRNARNIIILITDGKEECGGDPCAVSLALQRKGIVLKPFIIGVGLDVTTKSAFDCMGKYYDASTEAAFKNILNIVISQALNNTSAQVNILDNTTNLPRAISTLRYTIPIRALSNTTTYTR